MYVEEKKAIRQKILYQGRREFEGRRRARIIMCVMGRLKHKIVKVLARKWQSMMSTTNNKKKRRGGRGTRRGGEWFVL
jgi:hypothetical protein